MNRLIVKNFGPLKDIDIELNKINLFIGENGSGKSVLAKLIAILTNLEFEDKNGFIKKLEEFQINYLKDETYIKYSFDKYFIEFQDEKLTCSENVLSFISYST